MIDVPEPVYSDRNIREGWRLFKSFRQARKRQERGDSGNLQVQLAGFGIRPSPSSTPMRRLVVTIATTVAQ